MDFVNDDREPYLVFYKTYASGLELRHEGDEIGHDDALREVLRSFNFTLCENTHEFLTVNTKRGSAVTHRVKLSIERV